MLKETERKFFQKSKFLLRFRHFWKSFSNIVVLISSIPFGLILRLKLFDMKTTNTLIHVHNLILLLKVFESKKFAKYLDELLIVSRQNLIFNLIFVLHVSISYRKFLQFVNLNPVKAKLVEVLMLGGILTHWMGCMFFIVPIYADLLFGFPLQEKCWIVLHKTGEKHHFYIDMLFRSVSLLVSTYLMRQWNYETPLVKFINNRY